MFLLCLLVYASPVVAGDNNVNNALFPCQILRSDKISYLTLLGTPYTTEHDYFILFKPFFEILKLQQLLKLVLLRCCYYR